MKNHISVAAFAIAILVAATPAAAQEQVPQSVQQMQLTFAPLVKEAGPAVVNIYTKRVVRERAQAVSPFFNDPFFSRFFSMPEFSGPERERVQRSLGSGVVLDGRAGFAATNSHVIRDADEITVVTADGREFAAEKILDDPRVDLAILRLSLEGETLPQVELADSDALQVGDIVLAIGNPFGVGQTVTSGIISALGRTGIGSADYSAFIQTDAAINPGNSGGALIDMQGRLAGINTAIFSRDGGSLGIGFAIPSSMVRTVMQAARSGGRLVHPWTGIASQDVTPDMAESLGLKRGTGTLVAKVVPGSPADKAGLRPGDVILAVDGFELKDARAMKFRLATVPIGTQVKLSIWRGGRAAALALVTAAPPEVPPREQTELTGNNPLSGAVVVNISPAVIEEMGALGTDTGVVVAALKQGSALHLGLKKGDVILSVNDAEVRSVRDLKRAVQAAGRSWKLRVQRGGRAMSLTVTG